MSHRSPQGLGGAPLWDPTAIPAATVIVVREPSRGARRDGLEVLMLRRDSSLSFAAGAWVFPGGRIDPEDLAGDAGPEAAARVAAVREAAEEAGLGLEPDLLRRWSHWTPHPDSPRRRFSTAFFVAPLPSGAAEVRIDDQEIREHRWLQPSEVLEARDAGEVVLAPPTYVTLVQLAEHGDVAALMDAAEGRGVDRPVEHFSTRYATRTESEDEIVGLYHGDAGYDTADATVEGPRHRLRMGPTWRYERDL